MQNEFVRPELPRVDENDLTFIRPSSYYGSIFHYKGKPFSGFAVLDRYEDGRVQLEAEHANGEQLGWEVTYHPNGKVADQTLRYGATMVVFYEYDENGTKTDGGFLTAKSLYNECARITGMEPIDEDDA